MNTVILLLSCAIVALLAVIWLMWREIDAVRLHARAQEERADGAAGDAALWKVRFEDAYATADLLQQALRDERDCSNALCAELRDEIERQHELRDEQTDRADRLYDTLRGLTDYAQHSTARRLRISIEQVRRRLF